MWARDDVRTDQFADFGCSLGARIHCGLDAADVALGQYGDEPAANGDGFDQYDIGRLDHGIAGFNAANVALGFYHSYCFAHVNFWLLV